MRRSQRAHSLPLEPTFEEKWCATGTHLLAFRFQRPYCGPGCNPIFWALRLNSSLVELYLAHNGIGPDFGTVRDTKGDFGNSLAACVERNFTLRRLDLASNGLSSDCGVGFSNALSENSAILSVYFSVQKTHI